MKYAWPEIEAALPTLRPVKGGFTKARRGIVTMPDNSTLFVKIAVDDLTRMWINRERQAYSWLAAEKFAHIPELLAETEGGIAIPDLSAWDWENNWDDQKLQAFLGVIEDLAGYGVQAQGIFEDCAYGKNFWPELKHDMSSYMWLRKHITNQEWSELESIIKDEPLRQTYNNLAATEPWRGTDLTHSDVRADNCAYNRETGQVLMVDWNWLCIGNRQFDESMVFVNAANVNADLSNFVARFDTPCLAAMMGIWLSSLEREDPDEHMTTLRLFQLRNALETHKLIQQKTY